MVLHVLYHNVVYHGLLESGLRGPGWGAFGGDFRTSATYAEPGEYAKFEIWGHGEPRVGVVA